VTQKKQPNLKTKQSAAKLTRATKTNRNRKPNQKPEINAAERRAMRARPIYPGELTMFQENDPRALRAQLLACCASGMFSRSRTALEPALYDLERAGQFPRRIKLGGGVRGRVAWVESEVIAWFQERLAERDARSGSRQPIAA
jgi:predicted DNA-binding transcriptional regulator AlpA